MPRGGQKSCPGGGKIPQGWWNFREGIARAAKIILSPPDQFKFYALALIRSFLGLMGRKRVSIDVLKSLFSFFTFFFVSKAQLFLNFENRASLF